MFFRTGTASKQPLLLFLADGQIHAFAGGESMPNAAKLAQAFHWGQTKLCDHVLVCTMSDMQVITLKLNANMEENEVTSARLYELASSTGQNQGELYAAYTPLRSERDEELLGGFSADDLENWAKGAKHAKLNFIGAAPLGMYVMKRHFALRERSDSVMMILSAESSCVISRNAQGQTLLRCLHFGLKAMKEPGETWNARIQRRLSFIEGEKITLYTLEECEEVRTRLQDLLNPQSIVRIPLQDEIGELLKTRNETVHLAALPPPVRDPKSTATLLGILLLALAALPICLEAMDLEKEMEQLRAKQEVAKDQAAQNNEINARMKSLMQNQAYLQEVEAVLQGRQHVNKHYLTVFNLLAHYPLKYTRINSIVQEKNSVLITGESLWQEDYTRFLNHFDAQLRMNHLTLTLDKVQKMTDGKTMLEFIWRITPQTENEKTETAL